MIFLRLIACGLLAYAAASARATTTNDPALADIEGLQLARQLCDLRPAQSFTNSSTLKIRGGKARRADVPLTIFTLVTETNWVASYHSTRTNGVAGFSVYHFPGQPNEYHLEPGGIGDAAARGWLTQPFADSDFWGVDLATEFFHWPGQKLVKREIKKGQSCDVLESRPASVDTSGYSRVVSWIDRDTGGIVQAEAFDARGKLLKEFELKEAGKVNGEWRVTELEIRNVQSKSSTLLVFDYSK